MKTLSVVRVRDRGENFAIFVLGRRNIETFWLNIYPWGRSGLGSNTLGTQIQGNTIPKDWLTRESE